MRWAETSRCAGRSWYWLVVPKTVITNWQREFSTWGAFGVVLFHGDGRQALCCAAEN